MPTIKQLEPEDKALSAYDEDTTEEFDKPLRTVRAALRDLAESDKPDRLKIEVAKLVELVVGVACDANSFQQVKDLIESITTAHTLTGSVELRTLVDQAQHLNRSQQSMLVKTATRANDGTLELRPDGAAFRPRELQSNNTLPQTQSGSAGSGQQGTTGSVQQPDPAVTSPKQPTSGGEGQQSASKVTPPAAPAATPIQGVKAQQPAGGNGKQPAAAAPDQTQQPATQDDSTTTKKIRLPWNKDPR